MTYYRHFKDESRIHSLKSLIEKSATLGFDGSINIEYVTVAPDQVTCKVNVEDRHLQPAGIVHGGVYASLVEAAASAAGAAWLIDSGMPKAYVGMDNSTSFLRSVTEGVLRAESTPVHRGSKTQLWKVEIFNGSDDLVCLGQLRGQNVSLKSYRSDPK